MGLVRFLLEAIVERWQLLGAPRVIYDREGVDPYLSRYYILGRPTMPDGSYAFDKYGNMLPGAVSSRHGDNFGLYIHKFHRSDEDHALHNHPWQWAASLILAGGYREEKRVTLGTGDPRYSEPRYASVEARIFRPGDINVLTSDTFHRVDLLDGEAWSIFLVGPRFSSWGFWDRESGAFMPWRAFLAKIRSNGVAEEKN